MLGLYFQIRDDYANLSSVEVNETPQLTSLDTRYISDTHISVVSGSQFFFEI